MPELDREVRDVEAVQSELEIVQCHFELEQQNAGLGFAILMALLEEVEVGQAEVAVGVSRDNYSRLLCALFVLASY